MIQRFSSENLITKLYVEPPLLHRVFYINKPAAQAAGSDPPSTSSTNLSVFLVLFFYKKNVREKK